MLWHVYIYRRRKKRNNTKKKKPEKKPPHTQAQKERKINNINMDKDI